MKILILEDEIKTAKLLERYVKEVKPEARILQSIQSVEEAIEFLSKDELPDLIFMDIQLADGSSFEVFQEVDIRCPVIFCTAYNQYAVDAFKVNGIGYILKPFDREMVARALGKVDNLAGYFQQTRPQFKVIEELLSKTLRSTAKQSFLVYHKQKYLPVEVKEIAFFYIKNELTLIYTFSGGSYVIDQSLDTLDAMLSGSEFYRANRQFLIHFKAIKEVESYFARKLLVHLKLATPEPVIISKAKASHFMEWLSSR